MIKLTTLWKNQTKDGQFYLSGTLGNSRILIFPNGYKQKNNDPDFIVYVAEKNTNQGQQRQGGRRGRNQGGAGGSQGWPQGGAGNGNGNGNGNGWNPPGGFPWEDQGGQGQGGDFQGGGSQGGGQGLTWKDFQGGGQAGGQGGTAGGWL